MDGFIDVATLRDLAVRAAAIKQDCRCLQRDLAGWTAWPVGYRETDFAQIGTLARHAPEESIIEEYHPGATHYWSNDAPIAPRFYPYNQSTVWRCLGCQRLYLRHNDDGAYHVAPRIRLLQNALIVDAAHANDGREARAT
ncbi:hypothetical protein APT59_07490 [Pseudomonas oryzihabitans]|uniref:Uncharacterized protein n=1 Tax=Pseudomonas oryzihabitans TaxID=47885 RepID=A0A0U4NZJ6_9PSED|nr:hypothetical protein [Pseudomonas oryzihabitans]ALZ84065.1 hypothetical protein APT59_07490 [Pseudomonas oryzihabitans]